MKKKICSGIITAGILCSLSSCYAFDYHSDEAGFSVNVPDNNTVIVSNDIFVTGNSKIGMHGINAVNKSDIETYTKATFTTKKFQMDLQKMALDIKSGKDILSNPDYSYLTASKNEIQDYLQKMLQVGEGSFPGKKSYKVTKLNKIPALEIDHDMIVNYKFELPYPYTKEEQRNIKKYNPYINFSADGKQMLTQYNLVSKIYILSQNDQLYTLNSGYFLFNEDEKKPKIEKLDEDDNLIRVFMDNQVDIRAYNKAAKAFTKNTAFFKPTKSDSGLVIKDAVFKEEFTVPKDWLYIQNSQKIENTPFSFFAALPVKTIEKIGQEYFASKLLNIKSTATSLDIEASTNSNDFDLSKILGAYNEGLFSVSVEYKPKHANDPGFKKFLENPVFTEMMFENLMNKPLLTPKEKAIAEKFVKLKKLAYNMDINEKNCLIKFNYDLDIQVPKNFSNLNKSGYDIFREENLSNLQIYGQNKVYFDSDNKINFLCYFTQNKDTASKFIQKEYDAYDLFKTVQLKKY